MVSDTLQLQQVGSENYCVQILHDSYCHARKQKELLGIHDANGFSGQRKYIDTQEWLSNFSLSSKTTLHAAQQPVAQKQRTSPWRYERNIHGEEWFLLNESLSRTA